MKGNAGCIDRANDKEDQHRKAQDRSENRDQIIVDLESAQKTADRTTL